MKSAGGGNNGIGGLGGVILGASLLLKGDAAALIPAAKQTQPRHPSRNIEPAKDLPAPVFGETVREHDSPAEDEGASAANLPSAELTKQGRKGPHKPSVSAGGADNPASFTVTETPSLAQTLPAGMAQAANITETLTSGAEKPAISTPVADDGLAPEITQSVPDVLQVAPLQASRATDTPVPGFVPGFEPLAPEREAERALAPATLIPLQIASELVGASGIAAATTGETTSQGLPASGEGGGASTAVAAFEYGSAQAGARPEAAAIPEPALGNLDAHTEVKLAVTKVAYRHFSSNVDIPVTSAPAEARGNQKVDIPKPAFGLADPDLPPSSATELAVRDTPPVSMPAPDSAPPIEKPLSVAGDTSLVQTRPPLSQLGPIQISAAQPAPEKTALVDTSPRVLSDGAPVLDYSDELILQIETAKGEIADTIIAYGTRSGVYLPFGALTRFLDLGIAVSDDGNFASGWFLDETRKLTFDLHQGTLTVQGQEKPLVNGDAVAFDGELYVRVERIADILPLKLGVDLRAQTVRIDTLEPFPFEQRLAREEQREQLGSKPVAETPHWPREETPWKAFNFPLGDVEMRAASDNALDTRLEGDLRLASDLAYLTAQAFASATTRDGLVGARLELGRRDPDARLLGPMRATEFELGDVATDALPLGLRGTAGRGAFVTNTPLERASVFDLIDLRGELPNGYEVELYRNNVLLRSTRRSDNGQFEFLQVPVDYGLNIFRLVFYGPQGQRREEVRRISVGDGRLSAGEFHYSFGAAQKDVSLFGVEGPFFTPQQDYGAWRTTALLEYGLNSDLTLSAAGAWFESETGKRWMTSAGVRTGLGDVAMKFDIGMQPDGKAAQIGLGGVLGGIGYSFNHAEYGGEFIDEVHALASDFLKRATDLNFNSTFRLGGEQNPFLIPLSGRFRRVEYADERTTTDASLRASARVENFLASTTLDFTATAKPGAYSASQLLGSFDLATLSTSRTNYRGSINYALVPDVKVTAASIEVDHAVDDYTLVRGAVSQTLQGNETQFSLSGIREFGTFTLAFDGSYGVREGSYSAVLRLGFSFGRNPLTGSPFLYKPGLSTGGAVAIRAYRDVNGDRRYDVGDELLPDVEFGAGSQYQKTDAHGVAFLANLGDGTRTSFQVDEESLPDIAMAPANNGVEIVPRPGRIHVTDFGIVELSEIEGTAQFGGNGSNRGVSGLALQLVDANGEVVAATRTKSDGFFLFEQIPPGKYTIELDPVQATRLKIHMTEQSSLTVEPDGSVLRRQITIGSD